MSSVYSEPSEKSSSLPGAARARTAHAPRADKAGEIREIRKRLTESSNSLDAQVDLELILMFARNEVAAQGTILLVAAIFSAASMFWAPWPEAIVWLGAVIAAKVLLLETCRKLVATPPASSDLQSWRRRLVLLELLNGCAWAGFALVGMGHDPALSSPAAASPNVFLFASLVVVLGVRMAFASPLLSALYCGTLPLTLAVIVRLALQHDVFQMALAFMAAGIHIYFMFLARGLHATALAMLRYRTEKDTLVAELEEHRVISDAARRRAEDANVAKSRFLATMSHELRTPLNAILGFSEVMKTGVMGPMQNPVYTDYAGSIHDSGTHLLNLINEILDLSRIEAGRYDLNEEPLQLADIAGECRRLLKLRAESKGIALIERFEAGLADVRADERAVRQICLNLLSNALKFTPRGGTVTLIVENTPDGGQRLCITDTGPGIPDEEIPKVLQAFGQGSLAQHAAEGGTGLGLSIVQDLIQLHGGVFELHSELRKGTQAAVRFPASRSPRTRN